MMHLAWTNERTNERANEGMHACTVPARPALPVFEKCASAAQEIKREREREKKKEDQQEHPSARNRDRNVES